MARKPPKHPLIVVLGATGTGKSQLAVDLGKRFNGEIINGDAMQMYHGLPIVTNKITVEEQDGIPHHLLGFIALDEEPWRVSMFQREARKVIKEIRSRGRLPILVGGTHYYTQSVLFDDSLVGQDWDAEERVHNEVSNQEISERFPILDRPTGNIIEQLRVVDPVMADRWHPKDRRKIRRSLEIFLLTGKKASDIYVEQKASRSLARKTRQEEDPSKSEVGNDSTLVFWVHAELETLKKRLDARVHKMIESGLLDEVKSMEKYLQDQANSGASVDRTRGIWVSIGWKEFEPYLKALDSGDVSLEDLKKLYELCIEQTQSGTRQYAKRQIRWIRLKLMSALSDRNVLDKLYLLDGSNVANWSNAVSDPAINITSKFLEGGELRAPRELCNAAKELLVPEGEQLEKKDISFRQECEICNITVVVEEQWNTHLKSRRHRGLVKKNLKNEASGRLTGTKKEITFTASGRAGTEVLAVH